MIDEDGFRPNVGIILANDEGQLLWGRRVRSRDAWQFPQGGMQNGETAEEAMYRELEEELGLHAADVSILAQTEDWLYYHLPKRFIRYDSHPLCIGQKQKWFLLRLISKESQIQLDFSSEPEFDAWRWVSFWYPLDQIIDFKRDVYKKVLEQFESHV